jgi:WD40 repeat protein
VAAAAGFNFFGPAERVLRVWDLESARERVHPLDLPLDPDWRGFYSLEFALDDRLYAGGDGGVYRLDLPADPDAAVTGEAVHPAGAAGADLSDDGRLLLVGSTAGRQAPPSFDELRLFDLAAHTSRRITSHGVGLSWAALSPSGRIVVTGSHDGVVRVGPATGEEPHLLLGHEGSVMGLAISPDERWIASSSGESTSVWPMPAVTQPPLHTLPHAELLAKLDALTNLRVVRDLPSPTGWTLDVGPFPGWEDVPTW